MDIFILKTVTFNEARNIFPLQTSMCSPGSPYRYIKDKIDYLKFGLWFLCYIFDPTSFEWIPEISITSYGSISNFQRLIQQWAISNAWSNNKQFPTVSFNKRAQTDFKCTSTSMLIYKRETRELLNVHRINHTLTIELQNGNKQSPIETRHDRLKCPRHWTRGVGRRIIYATRHYRPRLHIIPTFYGAT